jgi:hypothetical protein
VTSANNLQQQQQQQQQLDQHAVLVEWPGVVGGSCRGQHSPLLCGPAGGDMCRISHRKPVLQAAYTFCQWRGFHVVDCCCCIQQHGCELVKRW